MRLTQIATRVGVALNKNRLQIVTAITKVAANVNFTNFSWTTCVNVRSMTTALQDRLNMSPYNCRILPSYDYQVRWYFKNVDTTGSRGHQCQVSLS